MAVDQQINALLGMADEDLRVDPEAHGRKIALAAANERIDALLELTKVRDLLRNFPSVAEAEAEV